MDQCKNCQLRGDMVKCFQEDCTIHESWYVLEILEHIKELTEQLQNTSSNSDYAKCPICGGKNGSHELDCNNPSCENT